MMCSALLGAYTFKSGWPLLISVILTVLVGVVFGILNGTMIAKLKLPPFIATLGTQYVSMGIGSIITKVQSQTWPTATAEVGGWFKKVFIRADLFGVKGFPVGAFWLIGFFVVAALILHKTKFGRYTYAIGSNEEAARLTGINVDNWKIAVYTLSGFFIGMSGLLYAAAYTTITPGTGNGQEMNGITAVVIGGTSMSGGSGTMVGTLIGVFVMSVLKTGLSACGLQAPWQTFFTGVVVIAAVLMDIQRTKAANKVKKS
jgi:ribose transport system permease protein